MARRGARQPQLAPAPGRVGAARVRVHRAARDLVGSNRGGARRHPQPPLVRGQRLARGGVRVGAGHPGRGAGRQKPPPKSARPPRAGACRPARRGSHTTRHTPANLSAQTSPARSPPDQPCAQPPRPSLRTNHRAHGALGDRHQLRLAPRQARPEHAAVAAAAEDGAKVARRAEAPRSVCVERERLRGRGGGQAPSGGMAGQGRAGRAREGGGRRRGGAWMSSARDGAGPTPSPADGEGAHSPPADGAASHTARGRRRPTARPPTCTQRWCRMSHTRTVSSLEALSRSVPASLISSARTLSVWPCGQGAGRGGEGVVEGGGESLMQQTGRLARQLQRAMGGGWRRKRRPRRLHVLRPNPRPRSRPRPRPHARACACARARLP
jgi:hypothetical protein